MATKRTPTPGTASVTAPTRTGGSTTWQRHISAEIGRLSAEMGAGFDAATTRMDALGAEISAERDVRQVRERAEGERRIARRATDSVVDQIHAKQQAEAERAAAGRKWMFTAASWISGELLTLIGQRLAPTSDMHAATIAGSVLSVLTAVGVYLKQRK